MNDDRHTIPGQVHIALKRVHRQGGRVVKRRECVLRPELRTAPVRDGSDATGWKEVAERHASSIVL